MATPEKISQPKQNRILAGLHDSDFERIQNDLEWVSLPAGEVLFKPGHPLEFIYFPISGIISRVFMTQEGSSTELAMTGKDGFVGIPLVLGGGRSAYKAVVQSTAQAYRMRSETFIWELEHTKGFLQPCLAYVQALMTQIAQSVVCHRHHRSEQQLCRWLLLSQDLLGGNQIDMTQEQIANMLGVRRECVTAAAGKLQEAGLIKYSRGRIFVLDRLGIESLVCECYHMVKSEYDRLFSLKAAPRPYERERPNPATLRQRAEKRFQEKPVSSVNSDMNNSRLINELQIHQIELEMNNEELKRAYDETDALRAHYLDVYDFAPIPYLTFDAAGSILEMNLAAAIMLCIKRSHKGRHHFDALLTEASAQAFHHFLQETLNGMMSRCEVNLRSNQHHAETPIKLEGVPDESGQECRVIMLNSQLSQTPPSVLAL